MTTPKTKINVEDLKDWLGVALYDEYLTDIGVEIIPRIEAATIAESLPHIENVYTLIVTGLRKSGESVFFSLIGRVMKNKKELQKAYHLMEAYQKEMYFYSELIPTFLAIQRDNELPMLTCLPTLIGIYSQDGVEIIVVNDPASNGFVDWKWEWDASMPNYRHYQLIAEEYGKFHAMSTALKEQRGHTFAKTVKALADRRPSAFDYFKFKLKKSLHAYVELDEEEENKIEVGALKVLEPGRDSEDFNVILHGDFWNHNVMFRYEDPTTREKPIEVVFLDWHHCRIGRPILDIFFLPYYRLEVHELKVVRGILDDYFQNLVKSKRQYHKCRTIEPYSFDVFWDDFENFFKLNTAVMANTTCMTRLDHIRTRMNYALLL